MEIIYAAEARDALIKIARYLKLRSRSDARNVKEDILKTIDLLSASPKLGRAQAKIGIRKIITPKYKYVIFYVFEVEFRRIIILTIFHPAQQRDNLDE